jgi:thiaminase/transcriptional activator TenA
MTFSESLLADGQDIWEAQTDHPFVVELAEGTLEEAAFRHWVKQDYRYLLDYARVFSLASTKADDEADMTHLMDVAHTILDYEMDLHREFAGEWGLTPSDLEAVQKAPTCVAYTNFLVRTAHESSIAEISAAIYPCGQGYLDIAEHMAEMADGEHQYTPFIEKYTSDEFEESVAWMREFVNRCAQRYPGEKEAMREAFMTSARLEHHFWEMCYSQEDWLC